MHLAQCKRACTVVPALLLAALTGGCGDFRTAGEPVPPPGAVEVADLAAVLSGAFDADRGVRRYGLIMPHAVARRSERLSAQLDRLARTGPTAAPERFADPAERLAYWYNARAAAALRLLEQAGFPKDLDGNDFYRRAVRIDGRELTLADIDAILLAEGGWRTVVAAPGVLLQRARLPERPFTAADVRERIAGRLSEFIDDDKRFVIDLPAREIQAPPVLWRFAEEIVRSHEERYRTSGATLPTALLPFVAGSGQRRLQDAIGYACVPAETSGAVALAD